MSVTNLICTSKEQLKSLNCASAVILVVFLGNVLNISASGEVELYSLSFRQTSLSYLKSTLSLH
jgi:hypothetical protein